MKNSLFSSLAKGKYLFIKLASLASIVTTAANANVLVLTCHADSEPCHVENNQQGSDYVCRYGIDTTVYATKDGELYGSFKLYDPDGSKIYDERTPSFLKRNFEYKNARQLIGRGVLARPNDPRLRNREIVNRIDLGSQYNDPSYPGTVRVMVDCIQGTNPGDCYSASNLNFEPHRYSDLGGQAQCKVVRPDLIP